MSTKPANDERSPPTAENVLFQMAIAHAKAAVALDKNRQYTAAIAKYTRAAEALVVFLQGNKNPKLQQVCAQKVLEYATRAKFLAISGKARGAGGTVARVTLVHEPPASCKGCRFYDQHRDDCRSVLWHLMKERRGENLHCPSHERGPALFCPGWKCYPCTPGEGCDD